MIDDGYDPSRLQGDMDSDLYCGFDSSGAK